jgi:transposase-like protein
MERDFVYCPGCARYSIVHWHQKLGRWECEDCSKQFPTENESWTPPATLAS